MSRRGSALAHVLVLSLTGALVCGLMLRARLAAATAAAETAGRVRDDLAGQGAINRVVEAWARSGPCASDAAAGVSCSGSGCSCRCDVAGGVAVTSAPDGAACALSAAPAAAP